MSKKPSDIDKKPKTKDHQMQEPQIRNADDEIDAAVAQSAIKKQKTKKKKTLIKRSIIGLTVLLLSYGIYFLFAPYKGTMAFGICKVFLELNVQYPTTIELNNVEEFATSIRIWFSHSDSFGEERMEPIQCYFRADEQLGFVLDKVTMRRREIDPAIVERFNGALSVVLSNPPDLTLPAPPEDALRNLQIDLSRFIKPIL